MSPQSPQITVAGYLSLDCIEGPEGSFRDVPGGAALYAALGVRAAGGRARLVARICDDFPATALDGLRALDIDLTRLEPTPGKTRRARLVQSVAAGGEEARRASPHHQSAHWWTRSRALAPTPCAEPADAMVLGPMPAEDLDRHLRAARAAGARAVVDTSEAFAECDAERLLALLQHVDLFAPSRGEVALMLPWLSLEEAQLELARRCPRVVQKLGPSGLLWSSSQNPSYHCASRARRLVDTTGAGDATVGALAVGLARGLAVPDLLEQASLVAARCVADVGPRGLGLKVPVLEQA
jgi:ribokinase